MKRSRMLLLPILFLSLVLTTCRDRPAVTGPTDVEPSFGQVADSENPTVHRMQELIIALYPDPGLETAALVRLANIQRQFERGQVAAAQDQARALASDVLGFAGDGRLEAPEDPPTVEAAVEELVTTLYEFVGLTDFTMGMFTPEADDTVFAENKWAAVIAGAGATDTPVYITLELLDQSACEDADDLTKAMGCWDIKRYPEGDFDEDVKVEICVADNPAMSDDEWDLLLLHHKSDNGEVSALPWVDPTAVDCTGFPGAGSQQTASRGPLGSLFASLGRHVASLVLPEPLAASPPIDRPPMGIGGTTGSFSLFYGAVPEGAWPHLVAWWPGDGNYRDMYGGSQVANVTGNVSFGDPAMFGSAFQFHHGGQIWIDPLSPEVEALQQLTVSTWVYLDPDGPTDRIQRFVSLGNEKAVLRQESGGNRTLHFYMGIDGSLHHIWVDNVLLAGCYHHVAGSYDGNTMRLYLDGEEVGTESVPGGVVTGGSGWARLGAYPTERLWGSLDEVMVFDQALDPSDIQAMYEAGGAGRCPATRVTGNIGFTRNDIWRTFAFNAWQEAGGTAHGHFEWSYPPPADPEEPYNHGEGYVTCMTIQDNEAWIGGVITYHATHPEYQGLEAVFRLADNTPLGGIDQMTLLAPLPYPPDFEGTAQDFCTTLPLWPDLWDIEWGDVIVRH